MASSSNEAAASSSRAVDAESRDYAHDCSLEWLTGLSTAASKTVAPNFGVIVLNGVEHTSPLLALARSAAVVIAADGAAAAFANDQGVVCDLLPHVVVGDMDSATPPQLQALEQAGVQVRKISSQDENDLFKALNLAAAEYTQVRHWAILTDSGGRLDQQMQSLNALWVFHQRFEQLLLLSASSLTLLLSGPQRGDGGAASKLASYRVHRAPIQTDTCGLIPMAAVDSVRTAGLRWECSGRMAMGGLVSSSNEMTGSSVLVETSGDLLWTASVQLPAQKT